MVLSPSRQSIHSLEACAGGGRPVGQVIEEPETLADSEPGSSSFAVDAFATVPRTLLDKVACTLEIVLKAWYICYCTTTDLIAGAFASFAMLFMLSCSSDV